MTERLVVIGGDAGGMAAASGVRRLRPEVEIIVVEKGGHTSYAMCGIPYVVAGEVDDVDSLVARSPEEFGAMGIEVRVHTEATAVDLDARTVETRDLDTGATERVGFDQLMIGTGARPIIPGWAHTDHPQVSVVHTLPDAVRLEAMAAGCEGRHVVVVGGGYIGIEMAEAFLARGARVTIVTRGSHLLGNLDPEMSDRVAAAARAEGIEVVLGQAVEGLTATTVVTASGAELSADIVVLALGVAPNSELAAAAGLATGSEGALVVDDHQRTSAEGVYAAGDCCESFHRVSGRPTWIALGTVANKAARVAGVNLAGGDAAFGGVLGTAITRLVGTEIARTGLTVAQASAAGFDPVGTTIESSTRAGYYPGSEPMAVRLVHDRATRRLLGGQIVGGAGAGKRIDTLATALWAGLAVDEMVDLDLAYAPPFGPVWDPVNTAARLAARPPGR
jgi:NADPH-dependent 2,4-dienoyl-CoA reductase/sulfur reductase-like enzyme